MIYRRPSINRLKSGAKVHFKSLQITLMKIILIYFIFNSQKTGIYAGIRNYELPSILLPPSAQ